MVTEKIHLYKSKNLSESEIVFLPRLMSSRGLFLFSVVARSPLR